MRILVFAGVASCDAGSVGKLREMRVISNDRCGLDLSIDCVSSLNQLDHLKDGQTIGFTRICDPQTKIGDHSKEGQVFLSATCCIADEVVCEAEMNMSSGRWLQSVVKKGNETTPIQLSEVEALHALRGPGVVKLYGSTIDSTGHISLVMEYIQGSTLKAHIASHPETIAFELKCWRDQVYSLTETLHQSGYCHNDFHFGNVMISQSLPFCHFD
jgi:hypothetical protein